MKEFMTKAEFAKHLGYDQRTISGFIEKGMPIIDSKLGSGIRFGKVTIPVDLAMEWLVKSTKEGVEK